MRPGAFQEPSRVETKVPETLLVQTDQLVLRLFLIQGALIEQELGRPK